MQKYVVQVTGLLLMGTLASACSGTITGSIGDESTASGGSGGTLATTTGSGGNTASLNLRPLNRLSEREYNNTLRVLLGTDSAPPLRLGRDPSGSHGFSQPGLSVPSETFLDHAISIGPQLRDRILTFDACATVNPFPAGCISALLKKFGRDAYRRPLTDTELTELLGHHATMKKDLAYDDREALRVVATAMLNSPQFLYHWQEVSGKDADKDGSLGLSDYAIASRLSYALWATMPDAELFSAADAGQLTNELGLAREVTRLLASPKFEAAVVDFHRQWLKSDRIVGTSKDPTLFPHFTAELKTAMAREIDWFSSYVFLSGDARLETLLTARESVIDPELTKIYGPSDPAAGDPKKTILKTTERAGILTRAAILASVSNPGATNPARAGSLVVERWLCEELPPPPANAASDFKMDSAIGVRANFNKIESQPACSSCHATINPIGFAFEQYDATGRYRQMDGIHAIDASGKISIDDSDKPFANLVELSALLARHPDVQSCVTRQWTRYLLGRLEFAADEKPLTQADADYRKNGFDLKRFIAGVLQSPVFRSRAVEPGEVSQ
jgi:Protein of unknown function (DUF1592)/Protein of unknown function (DUF1588)/Protein of unknown function (DUF1595)/Protein of unknown function (DUF1585)/Protein of unknown function (DUF1587)